MQIHRGCKCDVCGHRFRVSGQSGAVENKWMTFGKPGEYVQIWVGGNYGWRPDAMYKKRLNKVSRSVSIETFHANDSCIIEGGSGAEGRHEQGGRCDCA